MNQTRPSCQYCTQFDHTIEEFPMLMAKMQDNKVQPQHPTQNLQMMRAQLRKEDPNVNILLQSRIVTNDDEGKQLEEGGCVHQAPKKGTGFDLECTKETFMEEKKSFVEASTSRTQNKLPNTSLPTKVDPSMLTTFLDTCMKLLCNRKAIKGLEELIKKCVDKDNSPHGHYIVRNIDKHKRRTRCKMRLIAQIGDYEMDQLILDLGSNANVLPKQTWERMGRPTLQWSPIQLRMAN